MAGRCSWTTSLATSSEPEPVSSAARVAGRDSRPRACAASHAALSGRAQAGVGAGLHPARIGTGSRRRGRGKEPAGIVDRATSIFGEAVAFEYIDVCDCAVWVILENMDPVIAGAGK